MYENHLLFLENFLGGTFHQDVDSVESALQEVISGASKGYLNRINQFCTEFLNSNLSINQKNSFIRENSDIDFTYLGKQPVEWLKQDVLSLVCQAMDR